MKKALLYILLAAAMMISTGCSEEKVEDPSDTSAATESSSVSVDEESSRVRTMSSSIRSPLNTEQWGRAAKFSTSEQQYYDIPVRVMNVLRGQKAFSLVNEWAEKENWFTCSEAESGYEWIAVEYEINLDDFPVDSQGTDASVSSSLCGTDGEEPTAGGKKYSAVTVNLTEGTYGFEGIGKGIIAWQSPRVCDDIILVIGEYEETQAFFNISM